MDMQRPERPERPRRAVSNPPFGFLYTAMMGSNASGDTFGTQLMALGHCFGRQKGNIMSHAVRRGRRRSIMRELMTRRFAGTWKSRMELL